MLLNDTAIKLSYNSKVDVTVFFLIIVFWLILANSARKKDYGILCLKAGLALALIATVLKYVFFVTLKYTGNTDFEVWSYILYYVYNIVNLLTVCFYIDYLLHVIGTDKHFNKGIKLAYRYFLLICLGRSLVEGVKGNVIYYDGGLQIWHLNNTGLSFEICLYGLFVLALFILLISKKHFIKQVFMALVVTNIIGLVLYIVSFYQYDTSFINLIILFPFLVLFLMLYTVPFNFVTGALTYIDFEQYIKQRKAQKLSFLVIHFNKDLIGLTFNKESGKFLYTFWLDYFLKCFLFELDTNMFVLSIEDAFIKEGNLETVIEQELRPFVDALNTDYKIYGLCDVDFIQNIGEFLNLDLYFSNKVKKNTYRIFRDSLLEQAHKITDIVEGLHDIAEKKDLNDERILVYCQPVKNIKTNNFDTAEALMRMQLPDVGFVLPETFIPLAESFDYIHILSLIILNKTCKAIRKLLDDGYIVERISVNFCVREFKQATFCEEILGIIEDNNIPFDKIAIELTESKNEEDYSIIIPKITQLKEYGIKFYLDDFGTGYSNFDRILGLNLDIVKFDKSLLDMAETNKNTKFVLTHFSTAFKKLDYQILFEGVETDSQISLCIASKADYLQGFKYSEPIEIEKLTEFFRKVDDVEEESK